MTTVDHRPARSTCPSWCERRHAEGDVDPEGLRGLQWSPALADDGYWVDIPTVQNMDGDVVIRVKALDGDVVIRVKALDGDVVIRVTALDG